MLNSQILNDLSNKIKEIMNSSPLADMDKNINALIQGVFTKMELVSREEFDVQAKVLSKTQEQLVKLEIKLVELEAKHKR